MLYFGVVFQSGLCRRNETGGGFISKNDISIITYISPQTLGRNRIVGLKVNNSIISFFFPFISTTIVYGRFSGLDDYLYLEKEQANLGLLKTVVNARC